MRIEKKIDEKIMEIKFYCDRVDVERVIVE